MYVDNVNVNDIVIDLRVQRPLDALRVDSMVKNFSPSAVGVICLSRRDNSIYVCLDGQHRVAACKKSGVEFVTAEIYEGLTLAQEAEMFIERNSAQKVPYLDKFFVRVTSEDSIALGMLSEINNVKWRIPRQEIDGPEFFAVSAFEKIYRVDPNLARTILYVVSRSFGISGSDYRILRGLQEFYRLYNGKSYEGSIITIDDERLIERLSNYPKGPTELISKAQALYTVVGTSINRCVASLITKEYNKNLRKDGRSKLPELN